MSIGWRTLGLSKNAVQRGKLQAEDDKGPPDKQKHFQPGIYVRFIHVYACITLWSSSKKQKKCNGKKSPVVVIDDKENDQPQANGSNNTV